MPKKVRAGIADLYGEVQQWTEKEIIVENGVDEVLGQLDSAIDELLEKRKKGCRCDCDRSRCSCADRPE